MNHIKIIRPAVAAIAAAIALSSAPSFAQSTDVPVDPTATPVIESTPVPVAADPIAASPTVAADPVTRKTSATPARKATATKTVARARPAATRATSPAPTPAPAVAATAPIADAPAAQPLPLPVAPAPIATAPVAPAPTTARTIDVLPTAALAGLALLVLAGGALALRSRRRRRADEVEDAAWQQDAEAEPAPEAQPAPDTDLAMTTEPDFVPAEPAVAAVAAEPSPTSEDEFAEHQTDLPDDFDISRFGPNVQDAYRGPTEDNPSLSLKTRLSRAHGMDQQEQKLADEVEAVTGEPVLDESDKA